MRYLLDTATFLWALFDQREELSPKALKILRNSRNEFYVSAASIWEISIKYSLGKLDLKIAPAELLEQLTQAKELRHLPITYEHAVRTASLPFHHKDPFDRLLIAQAQVERIVVLTPDRKFRKYDLEAIW